MKLEDQKKLCDEATKGPWQHVIERASRGHHFLDRNQIISPARPLFLKGFDPQGGDWTIDNFTNNDCRFIAASRTLLPKHIEFAMLVKEEHDCPIKWIEHRQYCEICEALEKLEAE